MIAQQYLSVVSAALLAGLLLTLLLLASRYRRTKVVAPDSLPENSPEPAPETAKAPSYPLQVEPQASPAVVLAREVHSLLGQNKAAPDQNQPHETQPSDLATRHLAEARRHRDAGRMDEALAAFRSAAGLAAIHGPPRAHAEARLELAEVAFRAGDLTSACEHWQMARNALHDDSQDEGAKRVERRMRDNGCPTDWVLTDF